MKIILIGVTIYLDIDVNCVLLFYNKENPLFCLNVNLRCLWQRVLPRTIAVTTKGKESIPNVK